MAFTRLVPPSLEINPSEVERRITPKAKAPALSPKELAIDNYRAILLDDLHERYNAELIKSPEEYLKLDAEIRKRDLSSHFDDAGNFLENSAKPSPSIVDLEQQAKAARAQIEAEEPLRPARLLKETSQPKPSWKEAFAEKKIGLSKRVHRNFHSDSPGQMMFSSTTTMLGGMFMLEGLMSMIAPKTVPVMSEDGSVIEKRAHPLKRDLVTIGVGAGAVAAGLLINIEGKGR